MKRQLILPIGTAIFLGLVNFVIAADQPAPGADKDPNKEKPSALVTISKATTYATGPLRKDGYVNYVAALNQRMSQGVTAENNSVVLIVKAMGPNFVDTKYRDEYFRYLGIVALPEKGEYYHSLREYIANQKGKRQADGKEALQDAEFYANQWTTAMRRPWTKKEFPVLSDWLSANAKSLDLLVDAAKRSRYFDPLVPEDGSMAGTLPTGSMQRDREAARARVTRAMLRAGEGNVEAAWEDLLACHRLGRLVGQGPYLVDALVSIALDAIACRGDQALLGLKLASAQVASMRADLDRLPPMPHISKAISVGERFFFLDAVSRGARDGLGSLMDELSGGKKEEKSLSEKIASIAMRIGIDWDVVFKVGNMWFDRLATAMNKPTRVERQAEIAKIEREAREQQDKLKNWKQEALLVFLNPRTAVSRSIGEMLISLEMPALGAATNAEDRGSTRFELDRLAFALAAYRADHNAFPEKLEELAPKYVEKSPKDIYCDSAYHYRREGDGFLLYSVGLNGRDDGGKSQDDVKNGDDWDDIVVRVSITRKGI